MRLVEVDSPPGTQLLASALAATLRTSMARSVQRSERRGGVYRPARRNAPEPRGGGAAAA